MTEGPHGVSADPCVSLASSLCVLFSLFPAFSQHLLLRALRSDEAGAKLATAQIEGGYWLGTLEDAANHWAVESAWLQLAAYEAAQTAHGSDGLEFAKRHEPWHASMSKRASMPSSPRRGPSPIRAALARVLAARRPTRASRR
jgi:hypothetical protein